jgi:hypothetical protein
MRSEKMKSTKMKSTQLELEKTMDAMKPTRHFALGTTLILGCLTLSGIAQNQPAPSQPSSTNQASPAQSSPAPLGDYARKVRKDDQAKTKPKVFDNDNLPREDQISIVGAPASDSPASTDTGVSEAAGEAKAEAKTEGAAKAPEAGATGQPAAETKSNLKSPEEEEKARQAAWKQWQEKLSAQKDQIDLLTRELDVLQREYQIRAAAMYADVGNRLRNSTAWDKQDADYKQQIADKQKAVDDAKQKLDDMDEEARKAGVPASMREP